MAVLAAAQLLDELMGRNRNIAPNEKVKELNWEDSEYCKYYMVKFCPHDLFVNTRADLGACPKVHDDEVKAQFAVARNTKKLMYMEEFLRFCSAMVNEVERKIAKGKQRLALSGKGVLINSTSGNNENSGPTLITPAQTQRNNEQIQLLSERINGLVAEAEKAGTEGNVEQAQGLMKLCDQLKEEREQLRKQNENSHWTATAELAAAQEKQMEVCEVCGAFLIVGDAQQRIDDHLMGKQHMGYARLKAAVEEITLEVEKWREERKNPRNMTLGGSGGGLGSDDRRRERERDRDREHRERRDRERIDRERTDRERERTDRERVGRDKDRERREQRKERRDRSRDRGDRHYRHGMENSRDVRKHHGGSARDYYHHHNSRHSRR
ncbi:luc7-like protein 3 [Chrysoperla carnea]|uniref:luc7-like protein 3 n=1 Tax=Chrysoperla carnea TaxID=189513 RepID=UPI001D06F87E|nr:luc7-like protein 3 [Chrysoperla carnea]